MHAINADTVNGNVLQVLWLAAVVMVMFVP
jgi:hypothetical protein